MELERKKRACLVCLFGLLGLVLELVFGAFGISMRRSVFCWLLMEMEAEMEIQMVSRMTLLSQTTYLPWSDLYVIV